MKKGKQVIFILLLCLAFLALGSGLTMLWMQQTPVEIPQISNQPMDYEAMEDTAEEEIDFFILEGIPETAAPSNSEDAVGELYVSDARREYQSGSMRLVIPKLEINEGILDGVSGKKLAAGDGLYPYAQLPTEENGNVSIAGHRNGTRNGRPVASRKFYYLNTLTEGDYLYLIYNGTVYQYLWECTEVIPPDNWDPIRNRGYGCITLTTCTPIGVADHRLVVRGALVASYPESPEATLPISRPPY